MADRPMAARHAATRRAIERLRELLADGAGTSALCLALADYVRQNYAVADPARQAAELIVDRLVHRAEQVREAKRLDELLQTSAAATAELSRLPADDDSPHKGARESAGRGRR